MTLVAAFAVTTKALVSVPVPVGLKVTCNEQDPELKSHFSGVTLNGAVTDISTLDNPDFAVAAKVICFDASVPGLTCWKSKLHRLVDNPDRPDASGSGAVTGQTSAGLCIFSDGGFD